MCICACGCAAAEMISFSSYFKPLHPFQKLRRHDKCQQISAGIFLNVPFESWLLTHVVMGNIFNEYLT